MTNPELSPVSGKIEALTRHYESGKSAAEVSTEVASPGRLGAEHASLLLQMLHESLPNDATREQMHIMYRSQAEQEEGRRIYFTSVYSSQEQAAHLLRYDLEEADDETRVLDMNEVTPEEVYNELGDFSDGILTFGLRAQTSTEISGFSETGTCDRLENTRQAVESWLPGLKTSKRKFGHQAAEFAGLTDEEIEPLRDVSPEE